MRTCISLSTCQRSFYRWIWNLFWVSFLLFSGGDVVLVVFAFDIRPATSSSDVQAARLNLLRQAMNPLSIKQEHMLVAHNEKDEMIGFGQIRPLDETHAELASLFVQENYRRQGVGGMLVERLLEKHRQESKTSKKQKVCLLTLQPTVPFYEAHGFRLATKSEREALPKAFLLEFMAGSVLSAVLQNNIVCMIKYTEDSG
ncbi:acetyltransferase GNAT domain containing protein [Nitzschia inconspicua]|uniref:Acetyltransferase GNAT domain containing protein n=1 Tax=Nitzschia inconspicua TaxID=303405 RepID=A0A9K3PR39_9STRA|nr:acetyltransferase GNAT domain containing protein [Nitzschia inconspicua]